MNGVKYDSGKPDYTLLPLDALEQVVEVLTFGAAKYDRDNWKKVDKLAPTLLCGCYATYSGVHEA